jgi:hypothetical protein
VTPVIPPKWIGWILAVFTATLVLANQRETGIARDETVYMAYGVKYADWWMHAPARLSSDDITKAFGGPVPTDNNREHPPFIKTLAGFTHEILYKGLGVDEVTAFRVPGAILHGILVLLVFLMVLELWGTAEATVAALLVCFLPRALFHAGLLAFDAPIMCLWFATIYAYWRGIDKKWPWAVGVIWGLALATKHNALLLPGALGLHYAIVGYRDRGWAGIITYRWKIIVSLGVLGPLTLFMLWPWLWLDPIDHVRDWIQFHTGHVHYNYEYLGENWNAPPFPWHTVVVMTLFTVPVATLAAAVIGAGVWLRRRRGNTGDARMPGLLLVLSLAASIGPFFVSSTPIFGAEKHWMPALPTICIFAGVGTVWAARQLAALVVERARRAVIAGACAIVVGAALVETITAQPYALTWYNALAGEAPGGADRGMNRQFWGVSARGILPVLAADAPKGQEKIKKPIYSHDASPAWGMYIKRGEIPNTVPDSGHEEQGINASQYALVVHERHFNRHDYLIWRAYGTVQPMFVLRSHGVPIVSLYKRPRPR